MSIYLKNEANAARLLEWLDNGAPHTYFDIDTGVGSADDYQYGAKVDRCYDKSRAEGMPATCGTVCCIAGAADLMAAGIFGEPRAPAWPRSWHGVEARAMRWLGIDMDALPEQVDNVYLDLFNPSLAPTGATGQQAAQALRNFIAYGEPRWETV